MPAWFDLPSHPQVALSHLLFHTYLNPSGWHSRHRLLIGARNEINRNYENISIFTEILRLFPIVLYILRTWFRTKQQRAVRSAIFERNHQQTWYSLRFTTGTSMLWVDGQISSNFLPVKISKPTRWTLAWPCLPVFEVLISTTWMRF